MKFLPVLSWWYGGGNDNDIRTLQEVRFKMNDVRKHSLVASGGVKNADIYRQSMSSKVESTRHRKKTHAFLTFACILKDHDLVNSITALKTVLRHLFRPPKFLTGKQTNRTLPQNNNTSTSKWIIK